MIIIIADTEELVGVATQILDGATLLIRELVTRGCGYTVLSNERTLYMAAEFKLGQTVTSPVYKFVI
jgi:hypothetical protein